MPSYVAVPGYRRSTCRVCASVMTVRSPRYPNTRAHYGSCESPTVILLATLVCAVSEVQDALICLSCWTCRAALECRMKGLSHLSMGSRVWSVDETASTSTATERKTTWTGTVAPQRWRTCCFQGAH